MRFVTVPTSSRRVLSNWLRNNEPSQSSAPKVPTTGAPIPKISGPGTKQQSDHPERGRARLRANPGNRREQSRHACRLGADVYRVGVPVPNRCRLTDISAGGCYVEMPTPFASGTQIEILVRTQEMKLKMRGMVQSVHPGFGMGVKLNLTSPEDHDHLQSLIRLLAESGDNAEIGPVGDPWNR